MCAAQNTIATVITTPVVALLVFLMAFNPHSDHHDVNNTEEVPMLDINSQGMIAGQIFVEYYCI